MRDQVKSGARVNNTQTTPRAKKSRTAFYRCSLKANQPDFAEIICGIKSFVYFCIGKRTGQSTQDISYPHHSGVPGAVPIFGSVRLPKHKGASLFLCTYLK